MALTANQIWRDFETDGVSSSGAHKPIKSDIRTWGSALEAVGGFNVPGADTTAALFSGGVGVAPVWRKIVGFDLPNPSTTVPGAVFAKPATAGQILAGLGTDGEFDTASTTGTGNIVLSDNPNFTGSIQIGGVTFLSTAGGTHNVMGPDGRIGFQMLGSPQINYYKATTHEFYNVVGSDLFARLDQNTLELSPAMLTAGQTLPALTITQEWQNVSPAVANLVYLTVTPTNTNPNARFLRCDNTLSGVAGAPFMVGIDLQGSLILKGNIASQGVFVLNNKNFASVNGSGGIDRYNSAAGGIRWLTENGAKILESLTDVGDHEYWGSASGSHLVRAPAAAAGISTWPTTTGELINTGVGLVGGAICAVIDLNVAGDTVIPIRFVGGVNRFTIGSFQMANIGPGAASITTAQIQITTGPGGTGTILAATQGLTGLTGNTSGAPSNMINLTLTIGPFIWFDVASVPNIYVRVVTPQGAAARGVVRLNLAPWA